MMTVRAIGGPAYQEMIGEIDRELTEVIEDFDRAVGVEALRVANEISRLSSPQSVNFDTHGFVQSERSKNEWNESKSE